MKKVFLILFFTCILLPISIINIKASEVTVIDLDAKSLNQLVLEAVKEESIDENKNQVVKNDVGGSKWNFVLDGYDMIIRRHKIHFFKDGKCELDSDKGSYCYWNQKGKHLFFEVNNFSRTEVVINGNNFSGKSTNNSVDKFWNVNGTLEYLPKENQNTKVADNNKFHCMTGVMDESKTLRKIFYLKEGNDRCTPGMKKKGSFSGRVRRNDLDFYCFGPMLGMDNVKYFFKVDYKSKMKSNIICNKSAEIVYLNNPESETNQIVKIKPSPETTKIKDNVQNIQVTEDTSSPNIIVREEFESNSQLMAEISGSINDESEIASLTIDGYEVSIINSNFKKEFFVKPKGQDVEIVAIDIHGNKSSKIVSLKRQKIVIQQVKFDSLNPTKIKSEISENKVALIIGVENYKNTFSALYAENDALYFNDFAKTALGVPEENIKLLINNKAGRNDTLSALSLWLPKVLRENETHLYVYFSGHGLATEDTKDAYLIPNDGIPKLLESTSVMRSDLFKQIAKLNPKHVTVFLDTCYSGASRTEEILVASRPVVIEAKEQDIPTNFTIFSASSSTETAKVLEEAEHGLFSYYMMKGLEGDADANSDNQITNGELFAFINKNVSRQADQTPQLNGIADQVLTKW